MVTFKYFTPLLSVLRGPNNLPGVVSLFSGENSIGSSNRSMGGYFIAANL